MNQAHIKAVVEGVVPEVKAAIRPLLERLDELEKRTPETIIKWEPGIDGKDGVPGLNGKDGADGLAGKDGRDGIDGQDGASGPQGAAGLDGVHGKDGIDGIDGKDGTPGERGLPGEKGLDGAPGKDIDPELVQRLIAAVEGFEVLTKSLEDEIKALRAQPVAPASFLINDTGALLSVYPDGSTKSIGQVRGGDGERGASVMDGSIDDDGMLVMRMSDGRIVNIGAVRGPAGMNGKDGLPGRPGRDQIDLSIAPGIDETKNYPEGFVASYRGGLILAERQTHPIEGDDIAKAGWRTIMDGIADETERSIDDGRIIERTTTYTSGRIATRRIETAMAIYRGIWTEGTYQRGDIVTRDGSMWHCERVTTAAPDAYGRSEDWRLCVKRGQNGKAGADGSNSRDLTRDARKN